MSSSYTLHSFILGSVSPNESSFTENSPGSSYCIDDETGLLALACAKQNLSNTHSADESAGPVDILREDMQVNLRYELLDKYSAEDVSHLLTESLININDYLRRPVDGEQEIQLYSLAAVQLLSQQLCFVAAGEMQLQLFHSDSSTTVLEANTVDIGSVSELTPHHKNTPLSNGDYLLLCHRSYSDLLGHNFLQTTVKRFADHPDMLVRQLGMRVQRQQKNYPYLALLCRVQSRELSKRNWFSRFSAQ